MAFIDIINQSLSLNWRDIPSLTPGSWTPEQRATVASAMRRWVLSAEDARDVLRTITAADMRIGAWLSCVVARDALRYMSAEDKRRALTIGAIETTERWVRGEATVEECRDAESALGMSSAEGIGPVACAAATAAGIARQPNTSYACEFAYDVAHWAASADSKSSRAQDIYLRGLCKTIAAAAMAAVDAAAIGYTRV